MASTESSISTSITSNPNPGASIVREPTSSTTSSLAASSDEETTSRPSSQSLRPNLGSRKSTSMIVPADHPQLEIKDETFPPTDARAMSPRRSSADTDRMIGAARLGLQSQALEQQYALNALVEKVEVIRSDHDKLERNNSALQDYIGGLTRSMSKTALDTGRKK